jgi:hypothetical protein
VKIYTAEEFPQKSPEWHAIREKCMVTASDAGPWLVKDDKTSKAAREKRILKFLCRDCYRYGDARLLEIRERESKSLDFNLAVQRGNAFEDQAISAISRIIGKDIDPVGFISTDDGLFGASPDGLVGLIAGVECKVPLPETHLSYILEHMATGEMIGDYLYQVHFNMAVSGRDVWHFYSHSVERQDDAPEWIEHPPLHIEVRANEITSSIVTGMVRMKSEFESIRRKLRELRNDKISAPATLI